MTWYRLRLAVFHVGRRTNWLPQRLLGAVAKLAGVVRWGRR